MFSIDVELQQIIDPDGDAIPFEIESYRKRYLLQGTNDLSFITKRYSAIEAYEQRRFADQPWSRRYLRSQ